MRKQAVHPRTMNINNKQKNQSKTARHNALQWLIDKFPQAFDNKERIRPLKIGIMNDLLAYADEAALVGISKSKLREAVVVFTRRIDYLACLKAQEIRIDLFGKSTEQVTIEEAEKAALKIKKRIEKSIKNTHRPSQQSKTNTSNHQTPLSTPKLTPHYYPEPILNTPPSAKKRAPSITVKPSRIYDPTAMTRLKEKLGLSRKQNMSEET